MYVCIAYSMLCACAALFSIIYIMMMNYLEKMMMLLIHYIKR